MGRGAHRNLFEPFSLLRARRFSPPIGPRHSAARATGAPKARQAERATAQAELADRESPGERAERVTGAPKARQAERAPAQAEHEAIKNVTFKDN